MFFTGCRMFSPWQETYCQWLGFPLTECPSWNDSGGVYADHHHSGNGGDGDDVYSSDDDDADDGGGVQSEKKHELERPCHA